MLSRERGKGEAEKTRPILQGLHENERSWSTRLAYKDAPLDRYIVTDQVENISELCISSFFFSHSD